MFGSDGAAPGVGRAVVVEKRRADPEPNPVLELRLGLPPPFLLRSTTLRCLMLDSSRHTLRSSPSHPTPVGSDQLLYIKQCTGFPPTTPI